MERVRPDAQEDDEDRRGQGRLPRRSGNGGDSAAIATATADRSSRPSGSSGSGSPGTPPAASQIAATGSASRLGGRAVQRRAAGKLGADVPCGGGMGGEQVEHLLAVHHRPAMRRERAGEDALLGGVVPGLGMGEGAGPRRLLALGDPAPFVGRPADEGAGDLVEVLVAVGDGDSPRPWAPRPSAGSGR